MTTIEAQHPGVCGDCGQRFDVGTRLVRNDDAGWVHERCPEPSSPFDYDPERVCGSCWLVKSTAGSCGCKEGD